jgi:hypothetical protein
LTEFGWGEKADLYTTCRRAIFCRGKRYFLENRMAKVILFFYALPVHHPTIKMLPFEPSVFWPSVVR